MEDFQRITHHETDYSGTEGRRKSEERRGENVSLAGRAEAVPESGDVSKELVPL